MKMKFIRKLRLLIGKKPFEAEMAEEMRLHLELHAERNVATGMTNVEAHYAALRQFGGVEQIKEQCRDQRGWTWWEDLLRDVKFAARGLLRAPGFSFGVIATLTLGIGFSASVLSW